MVEGAIFVFDRHVKAMKALRDVRGKCGLEMLLLGSVRIRGFLQASALQKSPFFWGFAWNVRATI